MSIIFICFFMFCLVYLTNKKVLDIPTISRKKSGQYIKALSLLTVSATPQQKEPDNPVRLQVYANNYEQLQVTANNYVIVFQSKQPCSSRAVNHSTAAAWSAILPKDSFQARAKRSGDTANNRTHQDCSS